MHSSFKTMFLFLFFPFNKSVKGAFITHRNVLPVRVVNLRKALISVLLVGIGKILNDFLRFWIRLESVFLCLLHRRNIVLFPFKFTFRSFNCSVSTLYTLQNFLQMLFPDLREYSNIIQERSCIILALRSLLIILLNS